MSQSGQVDPFTAVAEGQRQEAYAVLARSGPVHQITTPSGVPVWLFMHGLTALPVALRPAPLSG